MEIKKNRLAIIGGSGFDNIQQLNITDTWKIETPYGDPSSSVILGQLFGQEIVFLPRHGETHSISPHKINYRANIWALHHLEVSHIVSFAAVGGISEHCRTGDLILPDQLIDYTWGREHTFYDGRDHQVEHIDFTHPYSESVRHWLIRASSRAKVDIISFGTYAVTQGPRLETPAEIKRLQRDGADVVGMTGMPETSLARELGIEYACIGMIVNPAAGKGEGEITMALVLANLETASEKALELIRNLVLDEL